MKSFKKVDSHKEVRCKTPQELADLIASLPGSEWTLAGFPSTFLDGTAQVVLKKTGFVEYKFTDTEMLDWMEANQARFGFTVGGETTVAFKLRSNGQYGSLSTGKNAREAMEKAMINIKIYKHDFQDEK
ncbi:hypothetical protein [Xanthomonas phage BUDD]|nr:hypothetical protein [Xanthomonas phage BUDD]